MIFLKNSIMISITLVLALTSCGKKNHHAPIVNSSPRTQTIFVKGDPHTLLEGATTNSQSFLTQENHKNFERFYLSSLVSFVQKEVIEETNEEKTSVEDGNEPTSDDQTKDREDVRPFYFYFSSEKNEYYYSDGEFNFVFIKNQDRTLSLKEFYINNEGPYPVTPIHYSLKEKEKNHFSILVEVDDEANGKTIMAFYFSAIVAPKDIKVTDEKYQDIYPYNYILGPGVLVNWPQSQTVSIDICAVDNGLVVREYQRSIQVWEKQLKNRIKIKSQFLDTYPPFSDLNNHCIYTVDNYLTLSHPTYVNIATTYSIAELLEGHFFDSDIFVWVKENNKFGKNSLENPEYIQTILRNTVIHELGHFLGLDHQFDENVKSIMSYEDGIYQLEDYDIKAISLLYPPFRNDDFNIFNQFK